MECTGDQLSVTAEAAVALLLTAAGGEREGPPGPQSTSAGRGESQTIGVVFFLFRSSAFVFIAIDLISLTHYSIEGPPSPQ